MSTAEQTSSDPDAAISTPAPHPQPPDVQRGMRMSGVVEQRCPQCGHATVRTAELVTEHGQVVATTARCSGCTGRHRRQDQS